MWWVQLLITLLMDAYAMGATVGHTCDGCICDGDTWVLDKLAIAIVLHRRVWHHWRWMSVDKSCGHSWVACKHSGELRLGGACKSLERLIYIVDASKWLRQFINSWQVIEIQVQSDLCDCAKLWVLHSRGIWTSWVKNKKWTRPTRGRISVA